MRKLSKVLSILLAMLMVFSAASIGVEAQYYAYKDVEMSYDAIDQPILSLDQYASMAMDEVDRMLMKENISFKEEFFGIKIEANFATIDQSLDSVSTVYTQFKGLLGRIGGDVQNLDFSALLDPSTGALNCPKRTDSGASDMDIFRALFQFLADNASILAKVPKGSKSDSNPDGLDLGLLGGFVDLGEKLNVPKLVKEMVCGIVYPELDKDQYNLNKSLDAYLADFIDRVLNGTYPAGKNKAIDRVSEVAQDFLPGLTDQIDFLGSSVYDVIEQSIRAVLDSQRAIDYINYTVRRWLHQFCGYKYIKTTGSDGKPIWTYDKAYNDNNPNFTPKYTDLVNLNFTLTSFNTSTWGDTTIIDHLNEILGKVVMAAFKTSTGITWTNGGNDKLLQNIRNAVTVVLDKTGDDFFPEYFQTLSTAQLNALTNDQFIAYILRAVMNGSISSVYVENDVTSMVGVLFETVRSIAADIVPSRNYDSWEASVDNLIAIGLDLAAYGMKGITSMNIDYGLDLDEFVEQAMEWVMDEKHYDGFVSDVQGTGWEAVNYVFFNLIPANWLPYKGDGSLRDDLEDILLTDVLENLENLNLPGVLALAQKNPDGELNNTVIEVLLARIVEIVNYVIPGTFPDGTYSTLESLLVPATLGGIIEGLLTGLNDRIDEIALPLLSIACSVLDLSTPEEFGYPYVSLEDSKIFNPDLTDSFYMYNGSSGINTAWTDKQGNDPHRDELYKYKINSIEVDNDELEVVTDLGTSPTNVTINGGTSQVFKFEGDFDAVMDSLLTVTINYDVYGETGQKMTPAPLTTTNYIYVSNTPDDGSEPEKTPGDGNLHAVLLELGVYLGKDTKVTDLADVAVTIRRNLSKQASQHARDAVVNATVTTLDSKLAALGVSGRTGWSQATTKNGGSWEFKPYVVAANNSNTLAEGKYQSTFDITASKTEINAASWTKKQTIWVYDDFGLSSYLRGAVRADRQQSSFGTGNYTASYIPFYSLSEIPEDGTKEEIEAAREALTEEFDVNGAEAWENYVNAVKEAAALVYAPRSANTFGEIAESFESAAEYLYTAIQEIDACSESSGAAGVKSALNAIIPDDTVPVLDDNGNVQYDDEGNVIKDNVPFNDPARTFFGREDYVSYTYSRFKPERRAAERVIDRWEKSLKGKDVEPISAVEAAYATHRLTLYANRLIRIRAYKEHLASAITRFTALHNAGKGSWSDETWENFDTAYNFAVSVNNEAIGSTYAGSENLKTDGLRQSKVNTARDYLIKTAKRLVEATTDFEALRTLVNNNKALYESGGAQYTDVSWAAFSSAYTAAKTVLANASATQAEVDAAYNTLSTKIAQLELAAVGGIEFVENDDGVLPEFIEESEEFGNKFVVGLSEDYIGDLESFISLSGGYTIDIIGNETKDEESTGAQLIVYDANGVEVATYVLVLYGEVTGEGEITPLDASVILAAANLDLNEDTGYWQEFDAPDQYAQSMAADVIHDGELTPYDASTLISALKGGRQINQHWKESGDPYTVAA